MNDINYIKAKFLQFDNSSENYPSKCCRILTAQGTFYFLAEQFKDLSVVNKLSYGDEIYVGLHQLDDGTYWLHWLLSDQKGELTIRRTIKFTLPQKITLLLFIPTVLAFIFNLIQLSIVLGLIFYLFLLISVMQFCYYLVHFYLTKPKKLRESFIKAKSGIHASTMFNNEILNASTSTFDKISVDSHFELLEGDVQSVVTSLYSNNKGQSHLDIAFLVKGQTIFLRETESSLNNLLVPHCYYRTHPTFIKQGDVLTVLLENKKARAIINQTDKASYLICKETWLSKKRIRAILINIYSMLIPALIILPFILILIGVESHFLIWLIVSAITLSVLPLLFIAIYGFCNLFVDHSSTKYARSWLKKLLGDKSPKEI